MSRFDQHSTEAKLARIETELELARLRDQRNHRHILKVMARQHAEVMAALHPPEAGKKASLSFGAPVSKPATPNPPSSAAGGSADKPKEKTR